MTTINVGDAAPRAKGNATRQPIGITEIPSAAVRTKLEVAALTFILMHLGAKPTRAEASLCAGAQLIASEALDFGFEDVTIFDTPAGWATSLTYKTGIDFTTSGHVFTADDLRCSSVLALSPSAALALFRGRDLLAGNPDVIGFACRAQRRAEMIGIGFKAALHDALTRSARLLVFHRGIIEQAAALIEHDGRVTRSTRGVNALLAAATAVPVQELPPAPEQARKLGCLLAACRMNLGALAAEISQLAQERRT